MRWHLDIQPVDGVTTMRGVNAERGQFPTRDTPPLAIPPGFTLELTADGARLIDAKGNRRPIYLLAVAPSPT